MEWPVPALGRPRGFDRDAALAAALRVFWTNGYEGASLADLTAAMGINRPSLYAAFGNKEALFAEALALYERQEGAPLDRLIEEAPTAREAIAATLRHNARVYAREGFPRGCLIVLSLMVGTPESAAVRALLAERRRAGTDALAARIARGQREGDVPPDADPARLAAFYTAVLHGMSVQARDGANEAELMAIAEAAMAGWPASPPAAAGGASTPP
jgi:AcrR family transcriptional regulator